MNGAARVWKGGRLQPASSPQHIRTTTSGFAMLVGDQRARSDNTIVPRGGGYAKGFIRNIDDLWNEL